MWQMSGGNNIVVHCAAMVTCKQRHATKIDDDGR
jgi:hypothetical protein